LLVDDFLRVVVPLFSVIRRISPDLFDVIPSLETLILTNNMIQELGEVDNLVRMANLSSLSLLFNPVSTKEFYRLYVIFRLPQLRILDFRKIKQKVSILTYMNSVSSFPIATVLSKHCKVKQIGTLTSLKEWKIDISGKIGKYEARVAGNRCNISLWRRYPFLFSISSD